MKKLYSLTKNGREIVSVEMDVPEFMPGTTLHRQWLKGIITTEVEDRVKPARRANRQVHSSRPRQPKLVKAAA